MNNIKIEENPFRYAYKGVHVDQICVLESFQRMNIGGFLMDKVEEFSIRNKVDQIELTFWDKNLHAKTFYKKRGFEVGMIFNTKRIKQ